ncbi:serine hydrolase [Micrococcaceae bacterium Sec5.8]
MDETTPQQRRSRPGSSGLTRRPRTRAFRRARAALLAVCAAVLAVALGVGIHSATQSRPANSGQAGAPSNGGTGSPASVPASDVAAVDPELDARIDAIIEGASDYEIGVALLDLSDGGQAAGAVHHYGVDGAFVAASTAKVLAAEAYYHLVETGGASLDDPLGAYTAGFQLQEMIQHSDNDSWSLIMDAVGYEELTEYAASMGVDYNPEGNELTPADMARILAGLYSGTLLEPANTAQLLGYMQNTNDETLIPAATPPGITVFHKYGLLEGELHDAGILARDGTAYALVVYTKGADLSSVPERTGVIHEVTEAVVEALF